MTNKNTTGILLLNLGGPDSLNAVRPFLYNLFSDREIIKLGPYIMQKPLAWLISTMRSSKSRNMYSLIGGKSPILDITKAQASALEELLNERSDSKQHLLKAGEQGKLFHDEENSQSETNLSISDSGSEISDSSVQFKVYIGMRYWHPFIEDTVHQIVDDGIKSLVVLSLYPHFSKTTTGSSLDEFRQAIADRDIKIEYIEQWYDFPLYIEALSDLVYRSMIEFKDTDFVVLYSAHNLPVSFINAGDPYLDQIRATIDKVNARLTSKPYNISGFSWELAFQSRSGPVEWMDPSTDETIIRLANEGCKNILVVPVSFVSDHVETLYEIDILFKELADKHTINLKRCPSLNTSDKFIHALKELIFSSSTISTNFIKTI